MKRIVTFVLAMMLCVAMMCTCLAERATGGARIGALTCIGMTEEDVKQWTEDIARAEGKETPYVNNNTIIFYDNLQSMILALIDGEIDRFSIGCSTASYIAERNENLVFNNRQHNAVLGYSIAMLSENSEQIEDIDRAIADMWEDGTLDPGEEPATEKQISFAQKIAERFGIKLPARKSKVEYWRFISEHKPKWDASFRRCDYDEDIPDDCPFDIGDFC